MRRGVLVGAGGVFAFLVACSHGGGDTRGVTRATVIGGEAAADETGVVLVVDVKNYNLCSGTLIAPNLVLTSRQCTTKLTSMTVDCATSTFALPQAAATVKVLTGANPSMTDLSTFLSCSEIHVPATTDKFCGGDIALLVLAKPVDEAVAKPIAPRLDKEAAPGEEFTAVGFGPAEPPSRKKRAGLVVSCLGPSCPAPEQAEVGEWSGEQALEPIDSGGPALDSTGVVFGLATRASTSDATYTGVTAFKSWIVDTAVHAATLGGYPLPTWAGGTSDAGSGGAGGASGAGSGGVAGGTGGSTGATGGKSSTDDSEDDGGCSVTTSSPLPSPAPAMLLPLLGLFLAMRSRRARPG